MGQDLTGRDLRAWRMSVNWSLEQCARALGYASRATVAKWESEELPVPTLPQLAIRWLMHVTPKRDIASAPRLARPKPRRWTTHEIAILTGFDSSPPGAILEMATQLGRSEHSISVRLTKLRKDGLAPKFDQTGRKRGAVGRKGPPPLPDTAAPHGRPASIMSDRSAPPADNGKGQWRSAVQGPQR